MSIKSFLLGCITLGLAACSGNADDDLQTPADGLQLTASSIYVLNDGNDVATFKVTMDGVDVTESSTIFQKVNGTSTPVSGYEFSTNEIGSYVFYASYQAKLSSELTIESIPERLEVPEDSKPDEYSNFTKKVLLTEGTSLDCNFCPKMIAGIQEFEKNSSSKDDVVTTVIHGVKGHDNFFTDATDKVALEMFTRGPIGGIPSSVINMKIDSSIGLGGTDTPESIADKIDEQVKSELLNEANTSVAANVRHNEGNWLMVSANIKVKTKGKYRINTWLLEDNLTDSKQQSGLTIELSNKYNFTTFNNVVRYVSSTSPITGSTLGGKVVCDGNSVYNYNHVIPMDKFEYKNIGNLKVVIIVNRADENSATFTTDNVIVCNVNSVKEFEYK